MKKGKATLPETCCVERSVENIDIGKRRKQRKEEQKEILRHTLKRNCKEQHVIVWGVGWGSNYVEITPNCLEANMLNNTLST